MDDDRETGPYNSSVTNRNSGVGLIIIRTRMGCKGRGGVGG